MLNGFITVERKKYNFVIEDNKLHLLPKNEKDKLGIFGKMFDKGRLGKEIVRKTFRGITSNGKLVYILSDNNYSFKEGIISYNIYAYAMLSRDISEIKGLNITSKELEYFYKTFRDVEFADIDYKDDKRGKIKFESRDFKNEKAVNEFCFNYRNEAYRCLFSFSHKLLGDNIYPIRITPTFSINFEKKKNLQNILNVVYDFKEFLKFISYRNDVLLEEIKLKIKNSTGLYETVGELFISDNSESTNDKKTLESIMDFDNIKPVFSVLFPALMKNDIILNHIPLNNSEKRKVNYARYLAICTSFEAEFRKSYGDSYKYKNNYDFRVIRNKIVKNMNRYINESKGKSKKIAKSFANITKKIDLSLEEALNIAFTDNKETLEPFIKYYFENVIKIEYNKKNINIMCSNIAKTRNDFAHANMNMDYNKISFLCLKLVEFLIYSMTLKRLGLDNKNIQNIINDLFKMRIALNK